MRQLKYTELLRKNRELGNSLRAEAPYSAVVLSNTTVDLFKDVFEYALRSEGLNAKVEFGGYDTIVQDSARFQDRRLVAIFWELGNLVDGLHHRAELLDDSQLEDLERRTLAEIDLVFRNLAAVPLVLMNRFTALPFAGAGQRRSRLELLADRLNAALERGAPKNARLIDLHKPLAEVGLPASVDFRYFYSSKALYTVEFFKAYSEQVLPLALASDGRARKALIFDCDNTLWKGILGEDGPDGIRMGLNTPDGAVFAEIQSLALALQRRGVLLGLCSKNGADDVDAVLKTHPDMQLRPETLAIRKVGWSDKTASLREIASELNIGLDSLVFVDDSPFEVELIRAQLPQVRVLQVPEKLEDYPSMLRRASALFETLSVAAEDGSKTRLYHEQRERAVEKASFSSTEDYLASLQQRVVIHERDAALTARMSQLCQKTNQFNVTTKRYTEPEIARLLAEPDAAVLAFAVADRFGDSGITGLCIARLSGAEAEIDTFLMSCRIIGRNIEYAVMDHLIAGFKNRRISLVRARHVRTAKNEPTQDFFSSAGFRLVKTDGPSREFELTVADYRPRGLPYIQVAAQASPPSAPAQQL